MLFSNLYFGVLEIQHGITIRENRISRKQNIGISLLMPMNFEVKTYTRRVIRLRSDVFEKTKGKYIIYVLQSVLSSSRFMFSHFYT